VLSIIITAKREAQTVGRAIEAVRAQGIAEPFEILVVCPDSPTAKAALQYPQVRHVKDQGLGKPAALNDALRSARGEVVVLTDGDVFLEQGAVTALLAALKSPAVGAVSGRPVSRNARNTLFGYWSHLLTDAADAVRRKRAARGQYLDCSGYLYAVRAGIIKNIPRDALSEDAVISSTLWHAGFKIAYAPSAKVWVQYPTTWSDWVRQKRRSTAGYTQRRLFPAHARMRTFFRELRGTGFALAYARNVRELGWSTLLLGARLWLWTQVFFAMRIQRRSPRSLWTRVETTKVP
jgi:cellulose synthase/poly-beta-1,6-N-acetylglucosamine synthase-like glycosyltransferase